MVSLRDVTGNWFSDPYLAIADRQVRSVTHVNKFGHNTCIAACTTEVIWDGSGAYTYPTQARIHNLTSSSSNDTAAGTGARTVQVFGLDSCYNEIDETVTLSGTSNAPTVKSYIRIFRMLVETAGSGETAAGEITATAAVDGSVSAIIASGNQTHMAIYTVPAGKTAYVTQVYGSIGRKQTATFSLKLDVRPLGGVFNNKFEIDGSSTGSSFVTHDFKPYIKIEGKSDIQMKGNASAAGADLTAGFDLILV